MGPDMSNVPCHGCRACCVHEVVVLSAADEANLASYEFRLLGERRVLKHKPNGECIHLSETGCTIYEKRPLVCRNYDCRKHFRILDASERRRFARSAMGEAAAARLKTLDAEDVADLDNYRQRTQPA
jgi:Fe-S-cluster containining protein